MSAISATVTKFMSLADGTLRMQIDVHDRYAQEALGLLCEVGAAVAIARLKDSPVEWHEHEPDQDVETEPEKDTLTGQILAGFYRNGFFQAPKVLKALGKDAEFLQWCRSQPKCWHCDAGYESPDNATIQAAHVRRVGVGAGTAHKPEFSAIPLCSDCHGIQHAVGESGLGPPEWWDSQAAKAREEWGHQKLRDLFGVESLSASVPAEHLWGFLNMEGLTTFTTVKVRDAIEQRQREAASGSPGGVGQDPVVEG